MLYGSHAAPLGGRGFIAPPRCTSSDVPPLCGPGCAQPSATAPRKGLLGIAVETNTSDKGSTEGGDGTKPAFFRSQGR